MEPQRQVSGTKVWNWRLQTFDVWNQKLKKSNLVLDLVTLIIINGQKHIWYIFSPGWSLCRGVGSCHAELSPTWTFSRQTQTLARPSENKICLRNVIWILHRCWKSFVNALQMYFQQWGVCLLNWKGCASWKNSSWKNSFLRFQILLEIRPSSSSECVAFLNLNSF